MNVRVHRGADCGSDYFSWISIPWINNIRSWEVLPLEEIDKPQYNLDSLLEESIKDLSKKNMRWKTTRGNFW